MTARQDLSSGPARLARCLAAPVAIAAIGALSPALARTQAAPAAAQASSSSSAPAPAAVVQTLPKPQPQEEAPPDRSADPNKPIISDKDFDDSLPALTDTETAPSTPPTSATAQETAQTPQAPMAPVVTPDDTELNAALPALEGYDVQAVQNSGPAPAVPPQIEYHTSVDGLAEIGQYDRFRTLSALHAAKGKAANVAMIRARANEDQALALRLMKSAGYFDGTVSATIATPPQDDKQIGKPVEVTITAVPGKPYKFGLIAVDAQPTIPPDLIRSSLPLHPGDIIVADQVLAAEANVSLVLPEHGYPFAKVGSRDIALDAKTFVGDYSLKVDTGNRSTFGGFTTDGKLAFDARHVAVLKRFRSGDLYDSRKVDDLRQELISTGLFRTVSVEPVRTGKIDADGNETVDLAVHQQAGPSRTLSAEGGYSTGEGLTISGTWTSRNLFPPEGALIVSSALGTQEQSLGVTFRRSNDGQRDRTLSFGASGAHTVYKSYEAFTSGFTGSVARVSTPIWQKVWTWSYGAELLNSRERATVPGTTLSQFETYYLANIPLQLGYDRSDDLLNPSKGYRLGAQGGPQFSLSGAGASSLRAVFDASYYYPFNPKTVIAARVRLGSLLGGSVATIAPSRRLYAGGGGSVRGFAYQALGPLDATGRPTGGTSLVEASVEARYRMGDLGIVPFIDMGQVYASDLPNLSDLRVGVGVGARLYTNFGPIRVDVATPLIRKANDPLVALYVGIGQAF
ncbi:BamA/TamA family outer membrane protein [Asticcacaulis solisilvae]|uniref:BamA/TamA family outer membrane protein n=1 Tax=Asticcacaulis solisilvae TaxID=1217274 RepID=UPI003FD73ED0